MVRYFNLFAKGFDHIRLPKTINKTKVNRVKFFLCFLTAEYNMADDNSKQESNRQFNKFSMH